MSKLASNPNTEQQQQQQKQQQLFTLSRDSTTSSSMSLIKVDELSPFGAMKQGRLPALIKLNSQTNVGDDKMHSESRKTVSMPVYNGSEIEQAPEQKPLGKQETSLPAGIDMPFPNDDTVKMNEKDEEDSVEREQDLTYEEDLHLVGLLSADLIGPSLPAPLSAKELASALDWSANATTNQFDPADEEERNSTTGDSLIEMIINLRNENQDLVHALETNNEYVKQRLDDFKRASEELKQREAKFITERSDYEQQIRKLNQQNTFLSDKVKTLRAQLAEAKVDIGKDSIHEKADFSVSNLAVSEGTQNMYPDLSHREFNNSDSDQETTMQIDDTKPTGSGDKKPQTSSGRLTLASDTAEKVGAMSTEELSKRFDAIKTDFYASDDRMEQCDKLEKQLNDTGMRDYEICLLQQQLNIYRQDFRLERMANLEAKIQIERLKNDIDKLCLERLKDRSQIYGEKGGVEAVGENKFVDNREEDFRDKSKHYYAGSYSRFDPGAAAGAVVSKLSHQLSKKAARSAAKAAKYASKQAYREERAAAAAAVAAATAATNQDNYDGTSQPGHQGDHRRNHSRHYGGGHHRGIKSEVVNDLWSTANKAMLTGYKMASTHVNNALDRLSQPTTIDSSTTNPANKQSGSSNKQERIGGPRVEPTAPPMRDSSLD